MANLGNFDATKVESLDGFQPLPAGKYVATITASDIRLNKAGTGRYLELAFTIIEGEYAGRQLWTRLNLENPNELAMKIARAELAAICKAVGVLTPQDSVELHNIPLVIRVACKKREDTGEFVNIIRGYERREAARAQQNSPPWRR